MTKRIVILLVAALALFGGGSYAESYKYRSVEGDPMNTRIYTLKNGLTVYMSVNKETPRIQTYIVVRVGAKNDPAETTGLAHYFEHLMFKGTGQFGTQNFAQEKVLLDQIEAQFEVYRTKTDSAERKAIYAKIDSLSYEASKIAIPNEYDKLMAAIGAEGTNAYTSYDETVYVEDIPSNQVENWAKIQADRFQNATIRGFHTELETVYEEKNMSLTKDNRKMFEGLLSALFPHHPYGTQTVLGTQEHLKNPSITNIRNYHKTWYVPNNMAVCLSGDFDPDEMIATIDRHFGSMKPNNNLPRLKLAAEPEFEAPVVKEVIGPEAESVILGWRMGGASSCESDILSLLSSILYNGQAGMFDLNLNQEQKLMGAGAYNVDFSDHGILYLYGMPKAGQTLDQVRDLMLEQIEKLKAGDFDEGLLEATINNYKAMIMNNIDSNGDRARMFVTTFVNNLDWSRQVNLLDRLSKLTKKDIVDLANRRLGTNNYAIIYKRQGKDPNGITIEKPGITPIFTNRDTASLFLREVQMSDVKPIEPVFLDFARDLTITKAKSNIELLYKKNETNDLFSLTYLFDTGSENDPAASLAFSYLEYLGTGDMTPEQIKQELYRLACSFSVHSTTRRSYVTLSGLGENMEKAVVILEKLLADARPNEAALANLKADMLKAREDAKANQRANFSALRKYGTFGPEAIKATRLSNHALEELSSEDLLSRIRSLNNYEHRILYYGPASEVQVKEMVGKLHRAPATLIPTDKERKFKILPTPSSKILFANYDSNQLYFMQQSNLGRIYAPADGPIITMYNEYFGGGMNSVVFQEMREARGLAYTAQAFLSSPAYANEPYTYLTFIATQNDKMSDAVEAFEEIINDMPQSETAFMLAKNAVISRMRTERIVKDAVIWSYIAARDMGIDYDRRKNIFEKVQTLSLSDVVGFQQEWIKNRPYTYMILGDREAIDLTPIQNLGPVTYLEKEDIFGY